MRIFWTICTIAGWALLVAAVVLLLEYIFAYLGWRGTWPPSGPGCYSGEFVIFECSGFVGAGALTFFLAIPVILFAYVPMMIESTVRSVIVVGSLPKSDVGTVSMVAMVWIGLGTLGIARMLWGFISRLVLSVRT